MQMKLLWKSRRIMIWLILLLNLAFTANAEDNSLLWGPYRPGLYFGIRPRVPNSFASGLLWYQSSTIAGIGSIRHECSNDDKVSKFGWTEYDPRLGGRQVVLDEENAVNITTELVKSQDGLSWEVKIKGEQAADHVTSLVWYASLESVQNDGSSVGEFLELSRKSARNLNKHGLKGDVELVGSAKSLGGNFRIHINEGHGSHPKHWHDYASVKPASNTHYYCLQVPSQHIWQAKEIYLTLIQDEINKFLEEYGEEGEDLPFWSIMSLGNSNELGGNTHFIQKAFQGPFEFNINYQKGDSDALKEDFDSQLKLILDQQQKKFEKSLKVQKPYTSPEHYVFAREMISSILGGIGYFYGDSLVRGEEGIVIRTDPHELFSGTPSRTFFPRGFYWDEGLNVMALMDYDTDLVLQILDSWFNTMDEDGWIEREQILGDEGRSRVPEEFQVQDPNIANPPTLVMALAHICTIKNQNEKLLKKLYPALQRHFEWFRRTQSGEIATLDREYPSKEVYRWRGRTVKHILASGLDDYPRALEPHDGELHVDLVSWIGAMARSLEQVATLLGEKDDAAHYQHVIDGIQSNLDAVFWSKEHQSYCDITVDEYEEDVSVCHIGYVTLMPFMLKLIPDANESQLLAVMSQLSDPKQLWSKGGIRSLSKEDPFFGTEENYWRGPVWNVMNYLTLDALQYYGGPDSTAGDKVKSRAAQIYHNLRRTVVENIYNQWKSSGYVWESYDSITGEPKGAKAFTGWAGLVANIMAMPDKLDIEPKHLDL